MLVGWRDATVDVGIQLDPEPAGVFDAIARAKEELDMNVELAAPDDFLPPLPDRRARSVFVGRHGPVAFWHYDFHAQALAKIERGRRQDLEDVAAMRRRGLFDSGRLRRLLETVEADLLRYPAIDPPSLRARVDAALAALPGTDR